MKKTISRYTIVRKKTELKKQEEKKEKLPTQISSYTSYYDLFKSINK
jgi:hypothetical protein